MLGYDDEASSDDEQVKSDGLNDEQAELEDDLEQEDLRDWGTSKADYYNADAIETEADALEEEEEARRLQQKQLRKLTEEDFGFNEHQWSEVENPIHAVSAGISTEKLPEQEVAKDAPLEERIRIFKNRYPEFEPLAKDYIALQKVHEDLSLAAQKAKAAAKFNSVVKANSEAVNSLQAPIAPVATTKLRALSAYLGCIMMYTAILTSTARPPFKQSMAISPAELRSHPVMQSLFLSKQLWDRVKDLPVPEVSDTAQQRAEDAQAENGLLVQVDENIRPASIVKGSQQRKRRRRTKSEQKAVKAERLAQAERQKRMQENEAKLADLNDLNDLIPSAENSVRRPAVMHSAVNGLDADDSDFGDEDVLTAQELAEKAQRKKSLRFYTSQIAQKANKRGAAAREAGGDVDLPYKERIKDRQARLTKNAEKRGTAAALDSERLGKTMDEVDEHNEDRGQKREEAALGEDYYNFIARKNKDKKAAKAELSALIQHSPHNKTNTSTLTPNSMTTDGKRGLPYQITHNKPLKPSDNQANNKTQRMKRKEGHSNNPRVKKKIRYEKKLKKLSSVRAVYKPGGEGKGGYGGELTGIKTDVRRGIKL